MSAGRTPVRILVVDDEPVARRGVLRLLEDEADVEVVGEARNGREAVQLIESLEPDLVFLDVQMPGMDGFECLESVDAGGGRLPLVVFMTAYEEYAIRAFEARALDYLLKPFSDERLRAVLERVKERMRSEELEEVGRRVRELVAGRRGRTRESSDALRDDVAGESGDRGERDEGEAAESPSDRILVRSGGRTRFLPVGEIDWIEAEDYYARLHVGGKSYLLRESLEALEKRLGPRGFYRVHRSAIVNLERIRSVEPLGVGRRTIRLQDGTEVVLSRRRRKGLEARLGRRL